LLPLISVALACYNGEKYVEQQLDSIFGQTYPAVEVVVSFDESSDNTFQVVQKFTEKVNFKLVKNNGLKGVVNNFKNAIQPTTGQYLAFSDQDDVWLTQKLEKSLKLIQSQEKISGQDYPIMVFTELTVTDSKLNTISGSYMTKMGLNPNNTSLAQLLIENVATGCTILMNRAMKDLITEMPCDAIMHDVFCAMAASCFGKILYLPITTVQYRQHGSNVIGASEKVISESLVRTISVRGNKSEFLQSEILNAEVFRNHYHSRLNEKQLNLLDHFIKIKSLSRMQRMIFLWGNGFKKGTFLKTANFYLKAFMM